MYLFIFLKTHITFMHFFYKVNNPWPFIMRCLKTELSLDSFEHYKAKHS